MATLTGVVTDTTGGVVPDAKITLTQTQKNISFVMATDAAGQYLFRSLPIGPYDVQAEKAGFNVFRQSGVELTVDSRQLVNITLQVGAVTQQIEVAADAMRVDTVSATLQQLVDSKRAQELPLNGRNLYQLGNLVPGSLPTAAAVGSINGGRSGQEEGGTTVNVRLDGNQNIEPEFNTILPAPPPDFVQEFTIQTSLPSAKYFYSAGVVEIATKSGTNKLHGSVYDFLRNDALDAKNFFASKVSRSRRNQYGFTVGGPVFLPKYDGRNRSFFFVGFEQQKEPLGVLTTIYVPTAAQRLGDFSGFASAIKDPLTGQPFLGNIIPPGRLDPVAVNLLDAFVPVAQEATGRYPYFRPGGNNPTQMMIRGDHTQGNNMFMWRSFWTRTSNPSGFGNLPSFANAATLISNTDNHTFSWMRTITPRAINSFRFGYARQRGVGGGILGKDESKKIGTPDKLQSLGWSASFAKGVEAGQGFFPDLNVNSFFEISSWLPYLVRGTDTFTFDDDMSLHRGKHNIQLGTHVMRGYQDDGNINVFASGAYGFSGAFTGSPLADFLLGRASSFTQWNELTGATLSNSFSWYVQDDIKVTGRFTLNLGLRHDVQLPIIQRQGKVMVFRPGSTAQSTAFVNAPPGLLFWGDPGVSKAGYETSKKDLGPRVGFSYALTGDQKTVLRAGYSIMYNPVWNNLTNQGANKQPFLTAIDLSAPPSIADPYANYPGGNPFPAPPTDRDFVFRDAGEFSFAPDYRSANTQQWNLDLQRELAKDYLLTVAYVGTKGTHLTLAPDINAAQYIPGGSTLGNLNSRRPFYPPMTSIIYLTTGGNSSYNALQISLDKRFSHGFTVLTSYSWSKSIDTESLNFDSGGVKPQDPNNFGAERAPSSWDRTHAFVSSWVWAIPGARQSNPLARQLLGGWSLTGILSFFSGAPLNMTTSIDNALRGLPNRPDKLKDAQLSGDRSQADKILQWFDTNAYAQNQPGQFGSAPRNDGRVRGPGSATFDFGVLKNFRITEAQGVQFRAEFFNFPNHTNLGKPQTNLASSTFGRISSAGSPRIIQFALKYVF